MLNSPVTISVNILKIDAMWKAVLWLVIVVTTWILSVLWSLSPSSYMVDKTSEQLKTTTTIITSSQPKDGNNNNIIYDCDNIIILDGRNEKVKNTNNDDDDGATSDTCTLSLDDDSSISSLSSQHNVSFSTPLVTMVHERPYTQAGEERDSMFYNSADYKRFKKNFRRFRKKQCVTFSPWLITTPVSKSYMKTQEEKKRQQQQASSLYSSLLNLFFSTGVNDNNNDEQSQQDIVLDEDFSNTSNDDDLFYSKEELGSFLNDYIECEDKEEKGNQQERQKLLINHKRKERHPKFFS